MIHLVQFWFLQMLMNVPKARILAKKTQNARILSEVTTAFVARVMKCHAITFVLMSTNAKLAIMNVKIQIRRAKILMVDLFALANLVMKGVQLMYAKVMYKIIVLNHTQAECCDCDILH